MFAESQLTSQYLCFVSVQHLLIAVHPSTLMHSLTFITFIVREKIATLKFLPRRTTGRPHTKHYIDSLFFLLSQREIRTYKSAWFTYKMILLKSTLMKKNCATNSTVLSVQFSYLTDWIVGGTWGTIQQRSSSSLFCRNKLNKMGESKHPWRTPAVVLKNSHSWLFNRTALLEFSYSA